MVVQIAPKFKLDKSSGVHNAYAYSNWGILLMYAYVHIPILTIIAGIGNADDLKSLDIPLVSHVPGVGQNLQDHLEIYVVQKCKKPVTLLKDQKFPRMIHVGLQWFYNQTGAAGTTHLESGGFTRSRPGVAHPDIMFHFLPSQVKISPITSMLYILEKIFKTEENPCI